VAGLALEASEEDPEADDPAPDEAADVPLAAASAPDDEPLEAA